MEKRLLRAVRAGSEAQRKFYQARLNRMSAGALSPEAPESSEMVLVCTRRCLDLVYGGCPGFGRIEVGGPVRLGASRVHAGISVRTSSGKQIPIESPARAGYVSAGGCGARAPGGGALDGPSGSFWATWDCGCLPTGGSSWRW